MVDLGGVIWYIGSVEFGDMKMRFTIESKDGIILYDGVNLEKVLSSYSHYVKHYVNETFILRSFIIKD